MNTVKVMKSELLAKIGANREQHRNEFEKALAGYRERCIEELEARLVDLRAGRRFDVAIRLPVPEDHTDDYNRVITMLEMSVDDEIEIYEQEFSQYVMDQWSWKGAFTTTNATYKK